MSIFMKERSKQEKDPLVSSAPIQEGGSEYSKADLEEAEDEMERLASAYMDALSGPRGKKFVRLDNELAEASARFNTIKDALKLKRQKLRQKTAKPEATPYRYSLDDLEKAKTELKLWEDRFANDSSNNPNKYQSQIKQARRAVRSIKEVLKMNGVLEMSEQEKITAELDKLYPNAKSKTIVEYTGRKYQIRYFPRERSRSRKSVTDWGHQWVLLEAPTTKTPQ